MSTRLLLAGVLAAAVVLPTAPAAVGAAAGAQVEIAGYRLPVPAGWRVVDLRSAPNSCVTSESPTIYLGSAGDQGHCGKPARYGAATLQIEPISNQVVATRASAPDVIQVPAGAAVQRTAGTGGDVRAHVRSAGVLVSATGGEQAARLLANATLTSRARPASVGSASVNATAAAVEPGTFRGKAFDACTAPPQATMDAWLQNSPYRGIGVYIGGISRACAQPNLTASWVSTQSSRGWAVLPIYVGLQAPCTSFGNRVSTDPATAESQGRAAASDAISDAGVLGIGAGSVLYNDMEGYDSSNATCRTAVLRFLSGWTKRLHEAGYGSGVYSSASSGIRDLSGVYGSSSYARPDHIWFAWWNGVANTDAGQYVPDDRWAARQRIHQYSGNVTESYGGRSLQIDRNYADVAYSGQSATQYGGFAITSRTSSGLDLFVRGSDGSVRHRNWNGTTWTWADLGGQTIADPAAVATGASRLDVFVLGTDYRLYVNTWKSGVSWSGWRRLSDTTFTSSPAATKRYDGGIDLFVRGSDSDIFHGYYNLTTGALAFTNLGGDMTSAPAAAASETGDYLTVFARGPDGTLYSRLWTAYNGPDGGWYSWVDRGAPIFGRPGTTSRGGRSIDVFYRDDNTDALTHWYSADATNWLDGNRVSLGGHIYAAPAALARGASRLDVFTRNNEAGIVQKYWTSGQSWSPYVGHGPVP